MYEIFVTHCAGKDERQVQKYASFFEAQSPDLPVQICFSPVVRQCGIADKIKYGRRSRPCGM
jgi:hypothetical protein